MGARIVIIEDNRENLELLVYLLQAFGHTALTASDGAQGMQTIQRERPDMIICDIQMPVMDGNEVARTLKADDELRSIPVVAVTAFAMRSDCQAMLDAGFDGVLTKPIDPAEFVEQIQAFLPPELHHQRDVKLSPGEQPARNHGPTRTVLVVAESSVNLDLASDVVRGCGHEVITAHDMPSALATARDRLPDLIVSDIGVADGSGFDLIKAVKADTRLRAIPFILLTSTTTSESERSKGLALGAQRCLPRPMDARELTNAIESLLQGA